MENVFVKLDSVYKLTNVTTISALVGIFTNKDVPCDLVCNVAEILSIADSKCHNSWFWGKTCTGRRVSLLKALGDLVIEQDNNQRQQQLQTKSIQNEKDVKQQEPNWLAHIKPV